MKELIALSNFHWFVSILQILKIHKTAGPMMRVQNVARQPWCGCWRHHPWSWWGGQPEGAWARQWWLMQTWRRWRPAPWMETRLGTCQGPAVRPWGESKGLPCPWETDGRSWQSRGNDGAQDTSRVVEAGRQPPRGQGTTGCSRPKPDGPKT